MLGMRRLGTANYALGLLGTRGKKIFFQNFFPKKFFFSKKQLLKIFCRSNFQKNSFSKKQLLGTRGKKIFFQNFFPKKFFFSKKQLLKIFCRSNPFFSNKSFFRKKFFQTKICLTLIKMLVSSKLFI